MTSPNRGLGLRTSAAPSNSPYWQLLRGLTPPILTPKVVCITATLVTAVQTELLLVKSATIGTPSSVTLSNALVDLGDGDAPNTRFATAWSAAPTITGASAALSRVTLPASTGGSVTWEFTDGELEVQDGESLLLWNIGASAGAELDVTCLFQGA